MLVGWDVEGMNTLHGIAAACNVVARSRGSRIVNVESMVVVVVVVRKSVCDPAVERVAWKVTRSMIAGYPPEQPSV